MAPVDLSGLLPAAPITRRPMVARLKWRLNTVSTVGKGYPQPLADAIRSRDTLDLICDGCQHPHWIEIVRPVFRPVSS